MDAHHPLEFGKDHQRSVESSKPKTYLGQLIRCVHGCRDRPVAVYESAHCSSKELEEVLYFECWYLMSPGLRKKWSLNPSRRGPFWR